MKEFEEIPLTKGYKAIIDIDDYERVSKFKWHVTGNEKIGFYARRSILENGKQRHIFLHGFITNQPKGMVVDHINHNTLDNRKCNLRICSFRENCQNRILIQRNNTSGFKGVCKIIRNGDIYWMVKIRVNNKQVTLGLLRDKIEAAKLYNKKALEIYSDRAILNVINL